MATASFRFMCRSYTHDLSLLWSLREARLLSEAALRCPPEEEEEAWEVEEEGVTGVSGG